MGTTIREARRSDKAPLMSFIKDIWGGHDYIPKVWDEWLRDKGAKMFVAEVDGRPVAMNRVRFMEDGSAWLEGVRVHPEFRRMGLASMLGRNSMNIALRRGIRLYRLTSGSANKPAHKQVAKMGFKAVARMSVYISGEKARFSQQKGVRRAKKEDVPALERAIRKSKEYAIGSGVYWDSFTATSMTPHVLARLAEEGSVYLSESAVAIAKLGGEGSDRWRQVCFATGTPEDIMRVVGHVFGKKEKWRASRKWVYAPSRTPLVSALSKAGFRRWGTLLLFEARAPKS
ncbi:MAG: GNAT family N-acetyltransferase [Nitrososphaerales archaeon]|nr:GNAT family N-acetyltransferase [Nitrososphaerales archaeon]